MVCGSMSSSMLLMAVLGVGLCVVGWSGGDESHTGMENTEWERQEVN